MLRVTDMAFGPKAKTDIHTRLGPTIFFVQEGTATVRKDWDNSSTTYGTDGYFYESGKEPFILENKPARPARFSRSRSCPRASATARPRSSSGRRERRAQRARDGERLRRRRSGAGSCGARAGGRAGILREARPAAPRTTRLGAPRVRSAASASRATGYRSEVTCGIGARAGLKPAVAPERPAPTAATSIDRHHRTDRKATAPQPRPRTSQSPLVVRTVSVLRSGIARWATAHHNSPAPTSRCLSPALRILVCQISQLPRQSRAVERLI